MSKKYQIIKNQQGSMVLELVLVAAVVAVIGAVVWRYNQAQSKVVTTTSAITHSAPVVPNGNVQNAVNATVQDATDELNTTSDMEGDTNVISSDAAQAAVVQGSIDENSF